MSYFDVIHILRMVTKCRILRRRPDIFKELRYFSKFVQQEFQNVSPFSLQ